MSWTKTYSKAGDFGGDFKPSQFQAVIEADAGITPTCTHINTVDDVIDVVFDAEVVGGELTTLNGLVSGNTTYTILTNELYTIDAKFALATGDGYINKATLTLTDIVAGDYYLQWSACVGNTDKTKPVLYRIQLDNTTDLVESGLVQHSTYINLSAVGGIKRLTLTNGTHTIDFDYKASPEGGSAEASDIVLRVIPA